MSKRHNRKRTRTRPRRRNELHSTVHPTDPITTSKVLHQATHNNLTADQSLPNARDQELDEELLESMSKIVKYLFDGELDYKDP